MSQPCLSLLLCLFLLISTDVLLMGVGVPVWLRGRAYIDALFFEPLCSYTRDTTQYDTWWYISYSGIL